MSATGGGHLASAIALEDALDHLYPGRFVCEIVDIYTDYGPFWPYNDMVRMYKFMADHPWTWELFFRFGETEFGLKLNEWMQSVLCYEPFSRCMKRTIGVASSSSSYSTPSYSMPSFAGDDEEQQLLLLQHQRADMVVSVHPLCQDLPLKILSDLDASEQNKTPFVTVVTDLGGAHKTWFHPAVDKCFVPSDALNKKAQSRGLDASSQIVQYGLPIRKGFWPNSNDNSNSNGDHQDSSSSSSDDGKKQVREALGIDDIPTVLVVGGGDGMGGIVDIASSLGKTLGTRDEKKKNSDDDAPGYQMVVVCGNNREARERLGRMRWPAGVRVNVQGYVRNMDEWMRASDCLVTKAGPGTIAEASICGLPCMLFAYLPGQEEGNIPFVEDSGFGKYSSDPDEIADTVSSWLGSPETLSGMQAAAVEASRPRATIDIARDLAEIGFSTKKEQRQRQRQQQQKLRVRVR